MKYLITIIILCFAQSVCKAQIDTNTTTGKNILTEVKLLQHKKIDTIVCYNVYCNGGMPRIVMPDSCIAYNIMYLIWSDHSRSFIQRFDECKLHTAVSIDPDFLKIVRLQYPKIKSQEIKYPEYNEKGSNQTLTVMRDHTCSTIFEIYTSNNILTKKIDDFAIETEYIDGKHKNDNYLSNQKSILNHLKKIAEKDVKLIKID